MEILSKLIRKFEKYTFTGDLYSLETLLNKINKALPRNQRHSTSFRKDIIEWKALFPKHEVNQIQLVALYNKNVKPKLLHSLKAIQRKEKIISSDSKKRSSNALGIVFVKETKLSKRKYDPWRDG